MKPYKKIILVSCISILLLKICSILFESGFKRYNRPWFTKMDHIFTDTLYNDVICLGNSRANFGINPYYIDSTCKTQTYNLGFAGADINGMSLILESYLERHRPPKKVVLCYDYSLFVFKTSLELEPVFFYYMHHEKIKQQVTRYGTNTKLLSLFPDLKYAFFNDQSRAAIIRGLTGRTVLSTVDRNIPSYKYDYRGFINYYPGKLNLNKSLDTSLFRIDTKALEVLYNIVNVCRKNNIKLIFIYPPELYLQSKPASQSTTTHKLKVDGIINSLVVKNNLYHKRFDLLDFTLYEFCDVAHVNLDGSQKFSIMLANYLKALPE